MRTDGINGLQHDIIKNINSDTRHRETKDFDEILEQAKKEKDDKALREACRELEAVFVNMVFKRMRDTVGKEGVIPKSYGERIFESMLDEEVASKASAGQGIGIADIVYRQVSKIL